MELTGEQKLALPRARVWEALNDPEILKRCLPGCDVFESDGENLYKVGMTASVGPVKARFNGKLTLSDIVPPSSYALSFEGSGGAAGFGKGNARVTLTDTDGGITTLAYAVNAQVGGKLAQVGARLIDGVAKKMADEFFTRFAKAVSVDAAPPAGAAGAVPLPGAVAAFQATPAAASSNSATSSANTPAAGAARSSGVTPAAAPPAAPAYAANAAPAMSGANAAPAATGDNTRNIAVLAAAVSAIGAAVAVLAAAFAMYLHH